jgi:hypothetical protein
MTDKTWRVDKLWPWRTAPTETTVCPALDAQTLAQALIDSNLIPRYIDYARKAGVEKTDVDGLALNWAEAILDELRHRWVFRMMDGFEGSGGWKSEPVTHCRLCGTIRGDWFIPGVLEDPPETEIDILPAPDAKP